MEGNGTGVTSIADRWPAKDISYMSIMGPLAIAAMLEWVLFLSAFIYCLIKVYQKAEYWSTKLLAMVMMIIFVVIRLTYLPVMAVTFPLPSRITKYFPEPMVSALQWFAFWTFAILLTVPWLLCLFQIVTHSVGRNRKIRYTLDSLTAPKVTVVMPVYKEHPDVLFKAINSVIECDYPASCLHVFLSFDGDEEDELYLKTAERLGVPLTIPMFPRSLDVIYKSVRVTISKFPHGGKRSCQKQTFRLIDKIYTEYMQLNDDIFVLFIDSDCILDVVCIQNFVFEMQLKPVLRKQLTAMTGVITSTTEKNSFLTILQDMEYVHGQLFERTVESACGAVTCLPGALTMLRMSAFRKMAKYYFADKAEQCDDLFDYGKCHLGEDRWLTHLFMVGAQRPYQIQMCTSAFCKTEAVQTFRSLLKQRRRWFLGYITNEACMLTDARLWRRYFLLCVLRLMQNTIRTTALLFFIMLVSVLTTEQTIQNLPIRFIGISLGLNWAMMFYFGLKLRRFKIWLYPVMFVVNPFFNWIYMVYGIFTAGQRTWGGPRADAGAADAQTTPQQAIEQAEATGDDLNIIPETFKPAVETRHPNRPLRAPLLPSGHIEGRFAPALRLPNGLYEQRNDSGLTFPNMVTRDLLLAGLDINQRRGSWDSFQSSGASTPCSIHLPRRVESLMETESLREESPTTAPVQPSTAHATGDGDSIKSHDTPEPSLHRASMNQLNNPSSRRSSSVAIPTHPGLNSRRSSLGNSLDFASGSNSPMFRPATPSPLAIQQSYSDPDPSAEGNAAGPSEPLIPNRRATTSNIPFAGTIQAYRRPPVLAADIPTAALEEFSLESWSGASLRQHGEPRSSADSQRSARRKLQKRPRGMTG